jgi:hypothetical protein
MVGNSTVRMLSQLLLHAVQVCYRQVNRMETQSSSPSRARGPRAGRGASLNRSVAAAVFGAASAGIAVACLTLQLNPQVHALTVDAVSLIALFFLYSVIVGCVAGASAWLLQQLAFAVLQPGSGRVVESALLGFLGLGPLLYAVSLPDLGLAGSALTSLIFSPGIAVKLITLGIVALILGGSGVVLHPMVKRTRRRLGLSRWALVAIGLTLTLGAATVWALAGSREAADSLSRNTAVDQQLPATSFINDPSPVVLLCIDGADLDDVILPMVETGELPTFSRLMVEGTWGELATFAPTLSPAIWTTLVTGKTKHAHGIHGFTVFQLPGLKASIFEFPLHSGLNFEILPLVERIPGVPPIRRPFTNDMRRAPALWNIVGRYHTVGYFHWRTTWPVEKVNGFALAEAVTLGETARGPAQSRDPSLSRHPPHVYKGLPRPPGLPPIDAVRPYLASGVPLESVTQWARFIRRSMSRYTIHYLPLLISRYQPIFTAAAFYSVDGFNHYFGTHHLRGGPFSPAVAERYRFTDARLGELIEALGNEFNLIVVSDHGYDFVNNNHTHAPPGIFFAHGPAFQPGLRVSGLTVFDVAPLVLHLLGLPPGEDMPAVTSRSYLAALDPTYVAEHAIPTVASWGSNQHVALRPRTDAEEEHILEELRSLGYIE